ncbi:MAG TPA: TraB/GumN family protein [Kofleriaceae bacterium]|nr:TraB/GumN family protein [Kofleriaceae bacterium]
MCRSRKQRTCHDNRAESWKSDPATAEIECGMRNRMQGQIAAAVAAVVVGALAAVAGCASAPPRCEIGSRDPEAPPLLWRVQRGDGPVVWLFGTIHDAGAGEVPPAAWAALDQSAIFVSELGDDDADPRKLGELARLPWGEVLDRMLPADDWWDLVAAMDGAMTAEELRHARPWFALVRLRARVVRSPRPSMDFALAEHAHKKAIAVAGLETWQEQVGALTTSATAADLSAAIHARGTFACQVAHLRTVYGAGDLAELTRMLVVPGRSDELLDERTRRWLPKIEQRFVGGAGAFVAVGLGHLLGEAGLVAAFERAGYRVERASAVRTARQNRPASASPAESRPTIGASAARSSRSVVALRKYQVSPPASAAAPIEPIAIPTLTSCMPDLAWSNTGSPGGALH